MAKAQRIEVYSNGPTTDGGARRNASVIQNWPSAPATPMPREPWPVGRDGTGCQSTCESPGPDAHQHEVPEHRGDVGLLRPSDRTVNALSE